MEQMAQMRAQLPAAASMEAAYRQDAPVTYQASTERMMGMLQGEPSSVGSSYGGSYPPPAPRIPYPPGLGSSQGPAPLGYGDHTQQSGFGSSGAMFAESAAALAVNRKRLTQEEHVAASDGSTDSLPTAKKQRVRRKKATAVPEASMGPPSAPLSSAPGGVRIAPSQYPPLPGTQDEPDLEALSQRSREISAAARKVKEPQVRSAWVRKDVALLIKAVNTFQCKWSAIEKEIREGRIPFERPRDQQALRDKARLLKQDFLK